MQPWTMFAVGAGFVMFVVFPLYINDRLWGRGKYTPRIILKGLGVFIAALMALYGAVTRPDTASFLIAAGLFAGALADILLELRFNLGMAVFFLGHLLYLSAFVRMAPLHPASAVILIILLAGMLYLFRGGLGKMGGGAVPYVLYAAVLLLMMSVAILLPWQIGARGSAAAIGGIFFVLSDILLAKRLLSPVSHSSAGSGRAGHEAAIMGLYYSGQLLLSLTALGGFAAL